MKPEMRNPQSELVLQGVHGRKVHRVAHALPGSQLLVPETTQRPAGSTPPFSDLKRTMAQTNNQMSKSRCVQSKAQARQKNSHWLMLKLNTKFYHKLLHVTATPKCNIRCTSELEVVMVGQFTTLYQSS